MGQSWSSNQGWGRNQEESGVSEDGGGSGGSGRSRRGGAEGRHFATATVLHSTQYRDRHTVNTSVRRQAGTLLTLLYRDRYYNTETGTLLTLV